MSKALAHSMLFAALVASSSVMAHGSKGKPAAEASAVTPAARAAAATVDTFHAALDHGDARAASALLANDVLIYESGEVERSKAEYAAHHLAADIEFTKAVPSVVTRRAGEAIGTTAWIVSEGRTTGSFHGKPIDRVTTETMILRRGPAGWRIAHIHWSSAAAK